MNQEQWLAERRRLGLPADPSKDFPPNFREAPGSIEQRFAAQKGARTGQAQPTYRAPAPRNQSSGAPAPAPAWTPQPSAERQPQRPSVPGPQPFPTPTPRTVTTTPRTPGGTVTTRKQKKAWPSLLVLIVVLGGVLSGPISRAFNDDSPVTDYTPESDYAVSESGSGEDDMKQNAPELARAIERKMSQFLEGNPKGIVSPNGSDLSTLTASGARSAMGTGAKFTVDYYSVEGGTAEVSGEIMTGVGPVPIDLTMTTDEDTGDWAMEPLGLPYLRADELPAQTQSINGVKVNIAALQKAGKNIAVWPGQLSLALSKDSLTEWTSNPIKANAISGIYASTAGDWLSVQAQGKRTAEFKRQAIAAVEANYQRCLKLSSFDLAGCPFSTDAQGITATRGLRFTQTKDPGTPSIVGAFGRERVAGGNGKVSISGSGLYQGQWTTLQGTLSVSYSGSLSVKNGKVVYSEGD